MTKFGDEITLVRWERTGPDGDDKEIVEEVSAPFFGEDKDSWYLVVEGKPVAFSKAKGSYGGRWSRV